MKINENGWLTPCTQILSPNFNQRPNPTDIRLIIIHNISLPPNQFGGSYVADFFQNKLDHSAHPYFEHLKGVEVSSHFFIRRNGEIIQFVSCLDRAWHAGQSSYLGQKNCNDFSIGIELEGADDVVYRTEQYSSLTQLCSAIHVAYPSTINHLAGHSDIARGRKTDPGSSFEWSSFRQMLAKKQPPI